MFEFEFKSEINKVNKDGALTEKLWEEIKSNYSKRGRHYHTLNHLENLFHELLHIKDKIEDWQTIIFSIAYHDVIYNTLKQNNEEKSAEFAFSKLTLLNLPAKQKEKCKEQILATKAHTVSANDDTNYFTDADLSILGADSNIYRKYSEQIRKEYKFYPDLLYNPGRQKVLKHFLEMQKIYKTDYFSGKYEQQALLNLENELKEIS